MRGCHFRDWRLRPAGLARRYFVSAWPPPHADGRFLSRFGMGARARGGKQGVPEGTADRDREGVEDGGFEPRLILRGGEFGDRPEGLIHGSRKRRRRAQES